MRPGLFAFAVASSFLGAALYINVVEQPARLVLDTRAMIREWKRNREPLMEAIASAGYYMWKEGDIETGSAKHQSIADALFE
jgi:hypothetical protein